MISIQLPSRDTMYRAIVDRDTSFDGVFFLGVKTTGIFCRPTCSAKNPREENVDYFGTTGQALNAGYRPCKRCRPIVPAGSPPSWLQTLLEAVEANPSRRWKDADIRALNLDPGRVRRWFQAHHDMTFHAYQRARRLGMALGQITDGGNLSGSAFDAGYESLSGFREAFERIFGDAPGRSRSTKKLTVRRLLTPLGPMLAGAVDEGICLLEFVDRRMLETQLERLKKHLDCVMAPGVHDHIDQLEAELQAYFEGGLKEFTVDLVAPGSEFQEMVWEELRNIPYGTTTSYEAMASRIGKPGAQRAVGKANGDNRIAIVIPCHRVIRSDGTLSGYGGGVWRKKHLLDLEGATESDLFSRR